MAIRSGRESVEEKGERIADDGGVVRVSKGVYDVSGDTDTYRVTGGRCVCRAAKFGSRCGHRVAVEIVEHRARLASPATVGEVEALKEEIAAMREEMEALRLHIRQVESLTSLY